MIRPNISHVQPARLANLVATVVTSWSLRFHRSRYYLPVHRGPTAPLVHAVHCHQRCRLSTCQGSQLGGTWHCLGSCRSSARFVCASTVAQPRMPGPKVCDARSWVSHVSLIDRCHKRLRMEGTIWGVTHVTVLGWRVNGCCNALLPSTDVITGVGEHLQKACKVWKDRDASDVIPCTGIFRGGLPTCLSGRLMEHVREHPVLPSRTCSGEGRFATVKDEVWAYYFFVVVLRIQCWVLNTYNFSPTIFICKWIKHWYI